MRKLWFIACEDPTVSEQLFCCLFFVKCCKILRHRPTEFSNLLFCFIYLSSKIDGRKNPFTITILSRPFYLVQRKDLQIISINFQLKLFSQSKKKPSHPQIWAQIKATMSAKALGGCAKCEILWSCVYQHEWTNSNENKWFCQSESRRFLFV